MSKSYRAEIVEFGTRSMYLSIVENALPEELIKGAKEGDQFIIVNEEGRMLH